MAATGQRTHQDRFEARHPGPTTLLSDPTLGAWLEAQPARALETGARLVVAPGDYFVATAGRFVVQPETSDERVVRAPWVVGVREAALRQPAAIWITALEPTAGVSVTAAAWTGLCAEHPGLRAFERALLADTLADVHAELLAVRRSLSDVYVPGTAALLPGPYVADDADMVVFVLESEDPDWRRCTLPCGVLPMPLVGQRFLLVLAHFRNVRCEHPLARGVRFDYRETTVFVPCIAAGRPGAFAPILFPDSLMAITLGREVYGFPKRYGRTTLDFAGRYADLEVDERLALWCAWGEPAAVDPGRFTDTFVEALLGGGRLADRVGDVAGLWFRKVFSRDVRTTFPPVSAIVRRQVPDVALPCERDVVNEVDALVRVPFEVGDVKAAQVLPDPHVTRVRADFLPASRAVWAGCLSLDMRFGVRQELRDLRGPLDRARLLSRAVRRTANRWADLARGIGSWI